ncbi:uncharacterized protein LOC123308216 [Coccinella septempunctata]|uniref:uncharacterized protein LOC123308216 n=1 Tax=Coccinella septempunctata TaxID=41139 RepID=UPI001D06D1E6|nr:uncharacterized protein LOC123308216 [Coccinella septempunctata]
MSHITVGYTDKVRKIQPRGPAGSISDIFGFSDDATVRNNKIIKQQESDNTNQNRDHTETKMCERTESLSIEANSNEVKKTVESTKIEEVKQTQVTTSVEVTNSECSNGNVKENGNAAKQYNNVVHSYEKDSATPQKRNRVPPGGYSAGFW